MSTEKPLAGGDLRSYGRRRVRALSPHQAMLWREVLPQVAIPCDARVLASPLRIFTPPAREAWLEIGFGGGEHLLWQAGHNRDVGFIGSEPFENGVVKVLADLQKTGLTNIRLHADDVRSLLRLLPDACIARAFVLFPDPWPKKRHRKRRLISEPLLNELARIMCAGAELRIATDIGDYARTMLLAIGRQGQFGWSAEGSRDWRQRPADWPATRYEHKATRDGRRCYYLSFRRAQPNR